MVRAPKCKVCGAEHFGVEHVWPQATNQRGQSDVVATEEQRFPLRAPPLPKEPDPAIVVDELKRGSDIKAPKRDRAPYMREYRAKHSKDKK